MCDVMISMIQFQFSNKELEFLLLFIFILFLVQNTWKFMKISLKYVRYEAFWDFIITLKDYEDSFGTGINQFVSYILQYF